MVIQDGTGQVLADTTPEKLLANTEDSVWSVIIDQTPAMQLQATYHVSTMVNQASGVALRLISATQNPYPGRRHLCKKPLTPWQNGRWDALCSRDVRGATPSRRQGFR